MKSLLCAFLSASSLAVADIAAADIKETLDVMLKNAAPIPITDAQRKQLIVYVTIGCAVNQNIFSALNYNTAAFSENIYKISADLASIKNFSDELLKSPKFGGFTNLAPETTTLWNGEKIAVRDGNQILRAIKAFADDALSAINEIQSGKGDAVDVTRIAADTAKISELIFQFLTMRAA